MPDNSFPLTQFDYIKAFQCLGADCPDTCCKGWGMQVDMQTLEKYKKEAPELVDAVTSGEAEHIMKRDPETDYCVKFDNGLCGIHASRGTEFLGDACHFYPRVTRQIGSGTTMAAAISCPEIVRIILEQATPFALSETTIDRLPNSIKNYAVENLADAEALAVHNYFINAAGDSSLSPEHIILRLDTVARSLSNIGQEKWLEAVEFLWPTAEGRLLPADIDEHDPLKLIQALLVLLKASKRTVRSRLQHTFDDISQAFDITLNMENAAIDIGKNGMQPYHTALQYWKESGYKAETDEILRRWIQAQLSISYFPFAGFGESLVERSTIFAIRFATLRLALMAKTSLERGIPKQDDIIRIIQSLSRFMDHLADPALSMHIYQDMGWTGEKRLRGLVEF